MTMSDDEKSSSDSEPTLLLTQNEKKAAIQEKILSGSYKLIPVDGRSNIWNVFAKIEDSNGLTVPDKVCCIDCYTILTFNNRTSSRNLTRHKCCCKYKNLDGRKKLAEATKIEKPKITSSLKTKRSPKLIKTVTSDSNSNHSLDNNQIKLNIINGTFKLRTKYSRCKVWHVFNFIEDSEGFKVPGRVCCKICFQVLNFHEHTTSNLVKHKCYKELKHTIYFEKTSDFIEIETSNCVENSNENNQCLEAASYTELDEFPPTKEWEESYEMDVVEKIPSTNRDTNINLKLEVEKIFSEWCIESFRPFKLAKDSGLRRFAEFMIWVGANHGTSVDIDNILPETKNISKIITSQYEKVFKNIKNEISENCQNGYGLTSKMWNDTYRQQSYISLTIHYIKNGQIISKLLGLNTVHNEGNINNIIQARLQETLDNFNCFCKDAIIVTDESVDMLTALNNFTHISCINHMLDNVINKAIKEVYEVEKLYNECLKIKEIFTQSNINCNVSAIFDSLCLTKRNAFYYLLNAIKKNWQEIQNILLENDQLFEYEDLNEQYIEEILEILKPFEHVSKKLECKEHPTIHLVYPCINGLEGSCSADDNYDDNIRNFKNVLSRQLQTTVSSNISITHKIALFLFPPANKLIQFDEEEKKLIKSEISSLLKPYAQDYCKPIKKASATSSKSSTVLSSYLKNFVMQPKNNSIDQISNEIHTYECLNIPFDDTFDILEWWHLRQSQFPLLYKLSCKILATPATCTTSGLVLSMVRQMNESNTAILSNFKALHQLIFLNFNNNKITTFEELYSDEIRLENNIIEEI